MGLSNVEDDFEIEVEFVNDEAVTHVIQDESNQKHCPKNLTGTPNCLQKTPKSSRTSTKSKKKQLSNHYSNDEYSENESDVILKPKALFEDGDVPGERMFSFKSKQNKTSTSQLSLQNTPTSKYKSINSHRHNEDIQEICVPQVLFDNDSENEFETPNKKLTRTTSKLQTKTKLLDNDSKGSTDNKFGYETPKKSKNTHNINNLKTKNSVDCTSNHNLTPKTFRSEKYIENEKVIVKTPRVVRKRIAKGIANQKFEQLNEINDSDYSISDNSDESDSDSSTHSNVKPLQPKENIINNSLRRSSRKKEVPFMYKSEEYFLSKSAKSLKKSKTSDNTLKQLKNPSLDQKQVDQLSRNSNATHIKKLKILYNETISNFPYWLCLLKEGFNLLLYGFGSKRQIINDFRTSLLEKESVLVVNGFFPGLTLKEILESIIIGLLGLESSPGSTELAIQQIEETQKLKNAEHIYILIHNLDGIELQNYKTQHVLSRICSLKNVHLIASIDKVNAALMFDNTKLGDYNFIWMDCTNYLPYTIETRFIESLMVNNTGSTHALSGLNNFFKSLTSNAKRILLLLIKDRIENKSNTKYGGVPFSILYHLCRQQFLVSTDLALRSQLVEFVDHELIKWKRNTDVLYVSVDVDVLIQFYKQNEEDVE